MLTRRQFAFAAALQGRRKPNVLFLLCERPQPDVSGSGVAFPRAYAANPTRLPARAVLQTGRYSHGAGVAWNGGALPVDQACVAESFAAAGYVTGYYGSWVLGGEVRRRGYQFSGGAEEAVVFVQRNRAVPFFLFVSLSGSAVGLLSMLGSLSLREETVVVVTSEDGLNGGWQEESARVPLSIAWQGRLAAGSEQDWLFSDVDMVPSLLGLCGIAPMESAQGEDRSALLLAGGMGTRPESIYLQGSLGTPGEWRMVIRGWDKMVVDRELLVTHLFNLAQDPMEMQNLVGDRATIRRQEELLALMRRWIIKAGDRVPYPGRAPAEEQNA